MKRLFDIFVAATLLVVLAPVFIAVGVLIHLKLGRPALFRQQRPGLESKPFVMLKFRTMMNAVDINNQVLADNLRLTRFGKILRGTSLDELPELWNVLKGDMSLVGPRPLLMEYLPLYSPDQRRRHEVRPGITGWAQINGRNALSWPEKFALDIWYVDNHSLKLDLYILWRTLAAVLTRHGINSDGHVTMMPFKGNSGAAP